MGEIDDIMTDLPPLPGPTPASTRWDLSDLVAAPRGEVSRRRLERLETRVAELEGFRGELKPAMAPERLARALALYEEIVEGIRILSTDGVLWVAEDTRVPEAQSYRNRLQQQLTGLHNRCRFLESWWKSLPEDAAARLLEHIDDPDACHFLRKLRLTQVFDLGEETENVVTLLNTYGQGFCVSLWSMLQNRLSFSIEVDGAARELSRSEVLSYAFSPRPELRAAAYQEMGRVYARESQILGTIYINVAQSWRAEKVQLRGYDSVLEARHLSNELTSEIVDSMFEAIRANRHVFHRYFAAKARHLGQERLHRYDLYAPWGTSNREISFPEALELIRGSFASFDPTFLELVDRVIDERRIDSEPRPGKWSGEFCSTVVPSLTPWVLVNYNSTIRDVPRVGHELGHAIHSMLAADHSVFTQVPGLPLAETSSIFCEMLVLDTMIEREDDPTLRRNLLGAWIDSVYAAVLRQAYLVLFEIEAHERVASGASVSDLEDIYKEKLREQFGDAVVMTDEFYDEWMGIHQLFHSPFYCYAYSFGQLLALALYQLYQEEGASFKSRYLELLAWGAGAPVDRILRDVGIDVEAPDFWQRGFQVIERQVRKLETL